MLMFDDSQRRVLALDPARHARVLGAPGTGKTLMLVEAFASSVNRPGWGDDEALVLASGRHVASRLRRQIEQRLDRAIAGTPVRTAGSLAFALLQADAAARGVTPSRLLTGTSHDESVAAVVNDIFEGRITPKPQLSFLPEVLRGEAFRAELRELERVLDDFALEPESLAAELEANALVPPDTAERWAAALALVAAVRARLRTERPGELTSSAMLRTACDMLLHDDQLRVPRLVLIDDAAEIGEGALALLAALANRGAKIWAFGDPDTATAVFQGERARLMAGVSVELERRGAARSDAHPTEQLVVLDRVYRHGPEIRRLVRDLSERIGTAGLGQQRKADAVTPPDALTPTEAAPHSAVRFAGVGTGSEQLGVIAHRMRTRRLGLHGQAPLPWREMAVVCRSRSEATRVSRQLAGLQVPSSVAAGGLVLREHQLVRELTRLLQHALGIAKLDAGGVVELLGGIVGGLDPIAIRRLRAAMKLQENRLARAENREPAGIDELVLEAFEFAGGAAVIDTRAARQLQRLGKLAESAAATHRAGGTPREVLWQLWQQSGLAPVLQARALDARASRADEANRSLDAVLGLFFALQRHEEQDSEQPVAELLADLLTSTVPEDSLAARGERDVITVTTPQSLVGRQFGLVCVLDLQDGVWPNLRARGTLLGVTALERWLRGEDAIAPSRRDTLHDELRLLTHAVSRASDEVLVVSISNEDQHPSSFFTLGRRHLVGEALPSSRLTLRGAVAEMRRRAVRDPGDREALDTLAVLARAGVPGAHPDEWYGVLPPSTEAPLADVEGDPQATVTVSPSQIEQLETCPLDWFVSRLSDGESGYRADIGTLLHYAFEQLDGSASTEQILDLVQSQWGGLRFEAQWQARRAETDVETMAKALADYLRAFEASQQTLLATEAEFVLPIGFARLRGTADRLEATIKEQGAPEVTVVDLKTGSRKPTAQQLEAHAQLQAYQLGVTRGALLPGAVNAGAKLVYVHPDAVGKRQRDRGEHYTEISQQGLGPAGQQAFEGRVLSAARVMAAARFTAQVEHHCEDPHAPGRACALQIIPAVSEA